MFSFFALLTRPIAYLLVALSMYSAVNLSNPLIGYPLAVIIFLLVARARRKQAFLLLFVAGLVISFLTSHIPTSTSDAGPAANGATFCGPALGVAALIFLVSRAALSPAGFTMAASIDEARRQDEERRRRDRALQQQVRGDIHNEVRHRVRDELRRYR